MRVKEMIEIYFSLYNPKMEFKVVANDGNGGNIIYYSGNGTWLRKEVAEMEVQRWLIVGKRKQDLIIFVERDEIFEENKRAIF